MRLIGRGSIAACAGVLVTLCVASAAPELRSGTSITATLVECGGPVDCILARWILPRAWLEPSRSIALHDITSLEGLAIIPIAKGELGGDMLPSTGLSLSDPKKVSITNGTALVPMGIDVEGVAPDHYTGVLQISGAGLTTTEVALDIRVRAGPRGPLLWLVAGVLLGVLARFMKNKGQRIVKGAATLRALFRLVENDSASNRRVLEPMLLEGQEQLDREQLDVLDKTLAAIEARRAMLAALDRVAPLLPNCRDEIQRIRAMIVLRDDTGARAAIEKLESVATRAKSSAGLAAPAAPKPGARPEPSTSWKVRAKHAFLRYAGPLLRWIAIGLAVAYGFKTLYVDGGSTYGASGIFDGIALLVWGLGTEIASRGLDEMSDLFVKPATPATLKPAANGSTKKRASLPGDVEIKERGVGTGSSSFVDWPRGPLHLDELHERGLDGEGVTVAVIDTGVASGQSQLDWQRIESADLSGGMGEDRNGHGTCMVGILASDVGMAPKVRVLSIQALDFNGTGSAADIAAGVDLAVSRGCDVISISAGLAEPDDTLEKAIFGAEQAGVLVISATRKENPDAPAYPASVDGVVATTPSRRNGRLRYPNPPPWVAIAAPGADIPTYDVSAPTSISGSSAATAVVAGVCACLLGARKDKARKELAGKLRGILAETGKPVDGGKLIQTIAAADKT